MSRFDLVAPEIIKRSLCFRYFVPSPSFEGERNARKFIIIRLYLQSWSGALGPRLYQGRSDPENGGFVRMPFGHFCPDWTRPNLDFWKICPGQCIWPRQQLNYGEGR